MFHSIMKDYQTITPDDDYSEVKECEFKGEHYSVRDNGAIMRHARDGKPHRKDDDVWTFGKKDEKKGFENLGHDYYLVYEFDSGKSAEYPNLPGLNRGNQTSKPDFMTWGDLMDRKE